MWGRTTEGLTSTTAEIRDLALQLPPDERALLACDLLDSLQSPSGAVAVELAWIDENEARADAYAAGEAPADDWIVSLERARQRLRQGTSP
ncbi:MAG: addiction module protein [Pirellulaceae bacterium]|nr:addiction module protein [Pirellulaceae bacterium]